MLKLRASLFVYFQFIVAGLFFLFPERQGLTCDMTTLWNIFFFPVAYLARSRGLGFEARHQNIARSQGGVG